MKATSLLLRVFLFPFAMLMAFCLHPHGAWAATTSASLVDSNLGAGTILNSPAKTLIPAVRTTVKENPKHPAGIVTAVLTGGRADADAIAPQVAVAAIEGLGPDPSSAIVGDIVYASVKATPAVVLEIVRATVKAAPGCANAIVKAAVMAVPNPNEKIQPVANTTPPAARGYAKDESKDDGKGLTEQPPVPLAEAIAQAACLGDPSLSYPDLLNTVNQAITLREGGGFQVTSVYEGYYYPPLISIETKKIRTALPTPPVVSK